jgi:hypothetical protein
VGIPLFIISGIIFILFLLVDLDLPPYFLTPWPEEAYLSNGLSCSTLLLAFSKV